MEQKKQEFSPRSKAFDYEDRYEVHGNRVNKKRIISGREYDDLITNL